MNETHLPLPHPALSNAAPAHLNCTVKRFIDLVLRSVARQLHLAGAEGPLQSSLSYHFDAGRSQPEGGGRETPRPATVVNASEAAGPNCSAEQLVACANAAQGLASLEGLASYLVDSVESGTARPTPEHVAKLGWRPISDLMRAGEATNRSSKRDSVGPMELGGGSGAGFQVVCDDKGLASAGGGGGGGAFGKFHLKPHGDESLGAGGGGGMQLFFPAVRNATPWGAEQWLSWGSGGGAGCGSCKPGDATCEASAKSISCGAKMDDVGAVDAKSAGDTAQWWRVGVLRQCYDAGRLAIIGGGGGGAGGAECCKAVPTLNFGFGFRVEMKPQPREESVTLRGQMARPVRTLEEIAQAESTCCPDLRPWNLTLHSGQSSSGAGELAFQQARRLADDGGGSSDDAGFEASLRGSGDPDVDPFARENGELNATYGSNRRPNLQEMILQHSSRLGVDSSEILNETKGPRCRLPAWLNESLDFDPANESWQPAAASSSSGDSKTKEPQRALEFIYKFNPLQGHLTDGAAACGGWSDWCCICHSAQRRIACLPDEQLNKVDWFLTEDCCESRLAKNTSSPGFVIDATPTRNDTVYWRPEAGWLARDSNENFSDSYEWQDDGSSLMLDSCAMPSLAVSSTHDGGAVLLGAGSSEQGGGDSEALAAEVARGSGADLLGLGAPVTPLTVVAFGCAVSLLAGRALKLLFSRQKLPLPELGPRASSVGGPDAVFISSGYMELTDM